MRVLVNSRAKFPRLSELQLCGRLVSRSDKVQSPRVGRSDSSGFETSIKTRRGAPCERGVS
jgi:hypothetical protein